MLNNWQFVNLEDVQNPKGRAIVSGPFGSNIGMRFFVPEGIPVIRGNNLTTDMRRFIDDGFVFITEEKANELGNCEALPGDLVFTAAGSLGQVGIIPDKPKYPRYIISNKQLRVRLDPEKVDKLFVFYWLSSPQMVENIQQQNTGSSVPLINLSILRKLRVPLPSLPEQRAIAGILGALDDKIELNRRMNRTLESMARAVFMEMMTGESGRMKVGTVGEDFNLTMGQSPPGETYNEDGEGIPFFQGRADFGFRYPENRVYCTAPTRFAKAGDTLVSVRAPVGDVNMAKEECAIGRGVAAVRHITGSRSYTYYAMKSLEENFGVFEGEGTVFGSINKADFQNLEIGIPTTEQVEQFEKTCYPIDQMIENNEKESRTLASLRDSLLPKLMKGEVRVKDVEN